MADKGYNVFLYGKFANIIKSKAKNVISFPNNNIKDIFYKVFQGLKDNTFHCINIQDTDLFGHESNVEKYIEILNEIDPYLKFLFKNQKVKFILTSDHGNDPKIKDGLHTREYVPMILNFQLPNHLHIQKLSEVSKLIANLSK